MKPQLRENAEGKVKVSQLRESDVVVGEAPAAWPSAVHVDEPDTLKTTRLRAAWWWQSVLIPRFECRISLKFEAKRSSLRFSECRSLDGLVASSSLRSAVGCDASSRTRLWPSASNATCVQSYK